MSGFVRAVPDGDTVDALPGVVLSGPAAAGFGRLLLWPAVFLAAGIACGAEAAGPTMSDPLPADALPVPPPRAEVEAHPAATLRATQGFTPAPVPNPDLQRPRADVLAEQPRTSVGLNLFNPPDRRNGEGYVRGSAGDYDPDRRLRASPGLNLRVPLQ